jgi:DNA-binding SARP family transcriptional activator
VESGWYGAAVDTALAALRADAYRESACAALIRAYLAEGNHHDARRQYDMFCEQLSQELGVEPSAALDRLMQSGRFSAPTGVRAAAS